MKTKGIENAFRQKARTRDAYESAVPMYSLIMASAATGNRVVPREVYYSDVKENAGGQ